MRILMTKMQLQFRLCLHQNMKKWATVYLGSELINLVHPLLEDPTLKVTVKQIRFCTTFLMIGFYLTIDITRTGI